MLDTSPQPILASATSADHPPVVDLSTVHRIGIEHTFEAAHRLPQLAGKCASLHGHSWQVTITVAAPALSPDVTVVEFGALKIRVRQWIDTYLDHGSMLGVDDQLVKPLLAAENKVFRFGAHDDVTASEQLAVDLAWPTVEAVAILLRRMSQHVLVTLPRALDARVDRVVVRETQHNTAECGPGAAA